ncbi:uncharacterized protein BCG_0605c-like [Anneissia japonica]|uniref:uncharacterized protein BCG_0605c-like n=1 Tax=Anneissia japonica TaxID=1529436 RepID=UPI0014255B29|nr:uncharacterized protein BCG_0605c-like [Anneissia japonica]
MNSSEACLYSSGRRAQKASVKYFMPDISINESEKVLDIGCGSGDLIYEIGTRAYSAIGIDISKDMIDVARQKYQRSNVTYEIADAKNFVETFQSGRVHLIKLFQSMLYTG